MSSTRIALEAALADNPDDLVTHAAYADLLAEEGDPRGEFVRLQLALEDRSQPVDRLLAMEQRASELRREHEESWLGPLAVHICPRLQTRATHESVPDNVTVTWQRGWVHRLKIRRLTSDLQDAIAAAPVCRLLADLSIRDNSITVTGRNGLVTLRYVGMRTLCESPNVRNLRVVELGRNHASQLTAFDGDLAELVARTPRLERLHVAAERFAPEQVFRATLPHLHTLHVTGSSNAVPLAILGLNSSLRRLAELSLDLVSCMTAGEIEPRRDPVHPDELRTFLMSPHWTELRSLSLRLPGFGDVGVDVLIASSLIRQLRVLDLCRCDITDDGAQALAACPGLSNLEILRLDFNYLSPIGINALAAVGINVSTQQHFADGWDFQYLSGRDPVRLDDFPM